MTTLYRVRRGWFGRCILQKLIEPEGDWRDVPHSKHIGLFTAVRIRYWQAVEAKLAQQKDLADKRASQRATKKQRDFQSSKFSDTRMPPP